MRIGFVYLLFGISFLCIHVVQGQDVQTNPEQPKLNGAYFKHFLSDAGYVFSAPARWKGKEWAKAGVITGGTLALYFLADQDVADFTQREKYRGIDIAAEIVEPYGNGRFAIGYPVLAYLAGAAFQNQKVKRTGLLMFESYILTGITYQASLFLFSRNRPDTGRRAFDTFQGPNLTPKQSFMSGHTAIAFCLSTTIAMEFGDTKWVPPVMYSLAALTSLSRIYDNRHWSADVFVGAIAGHLIAKSVVRRQRLRDGENDGSNLSFSPIISPSGYGISLTCQLK